jgi:hypothetical protein
MKHFTVRFIVGLITFTFGVVASTLWIVNRFHQSAKSHPEPINERVSLPSPNPTAEISVPVTPEEPTYRDVAMYIANRILELKGKVAGFESINRAKNIYVKEYPFKPIVDYRYRVLRYKPIPDSEPPMEEAIFRKGGFMLTVWMVKGELTWKPERPPVEIGAYKIDVQVTESERDRIQPIIDRIVAEAAEHFNGKAQSNKSFHLTAR